ELQPSLLCAFHIDLEMHPILLQDEIDGHSRLRKSAGIPDRQSVATAEILQHLFDLRPFRGADEKNLARSGVSNTIEKQYLDSSSPNPLPVRNLLQLISEGFWLRTQIKNGASLLGKAPDGQSTNLAKL